MENTEWNLDNLYTSFNSQEFKSDCEKLKAQIKDINKWVNNNLNTKENAIEKLEYYINFQNNIGNLSERLYDYAQLFLSTNATDETALKVSERLEEELTELTPADTKFQSWVCSLSDIDSLVSNSEILKEHLYYINEIKTHGKYMLSNSEEILIAKFKNTGSSSWSKLQELLASTLNVKIIIDGEEKSLPLPSIRNLAYESNPELRKNAYMAELSACESISKSSAACLNGIKGEVVTECKQRGYSSPLEMTLLNSRMDKETLNAIIFAMKKSLPFFQKYFLKKSEILGHKEGLPFYDFFAPIGKTDMKFTYEEAKDFIILNFSTFSNELGEYATRAFNNSWIDIYPKEGKRGGAFCSNLHSIGESRILTNFTGSFSDVITIAHELGHGYHGYCLDNETNLNSDYPMPIAETASTFCETIVKSAALKTATEEEKQIILENDISDCAQLIVDILSRFIFEDTVFKLRPDGSLSPNELCNIMLDAQRQTYGVGLNDRFMHKYMWVCKSHYYDADYNYYNFPYAFGLLFAKGLYSLYIKKGSEFASDYKKLLASTGKNDLLTIAKIAGIDIHSSEFWESSIEIIKKDIEMFVKH